MKPDVPNWKRGESITAADLNKLAQAAGRDIVARGGFSGSDGTSIRSLFKRGGNTTVTGSSSTVDIKIVLIDDDIDGVTEDDPSAILDDSYFETAGGARFFDGDGTDATEMDELNLWAYERVLVYLKYFVVPSESDPGYESGKFKMVLATVEDDSGTEITVWYDSLPVWVDNGEPLKVGKYSRGDFQDDPNFEEDGVWPPPWIDDPDTFFKKRYRGIAIKATLEDGTQGYVLVRDMCYVLPPPALPAPE
jgi:hypothetical protein